MTILYYTLIFLPTILLFVGGLLTVFKVGEGQNISNYGYVAPIEK